jgi:hypothetical protein
MHSQKRIAYLVRLRRQQTGEEHDRLIFAKDEAAAGERAVVRARRALATTFIEREYGQFEVLSCAPAVNQGRCYGSAARILHPSLLI